MCLIIAIVENGKSCLSVSITMKIFDRVHTYVPIFMSSAKLHKLYFINNKTYYLNDYIRLCAGYDLEILARDIRGIPKLHFRLKKFNVLLNDT